MAAPTGGEYGERKASLDAQSQIPLPSTSTDLQTALAAAQASAPPEGSLAAPTARPNEPVTAGLPTGAGPGPSSLAPFAGPASRGVSDLEMVRAMYRRMPTEAVRRVLERLERTSGPDRPIPARGALPGAPAPTPGAVGNQAGVQAGFQGMPTGGRAGRISAREGLQAASGSPDTTEG